MELPVHRIQCYSFSPLPFTCVSRSDSSLIAAARSDATIEVYDESRNFFLVARVPGSVTTSVESLAWLGSRLFYTGALGRLCEVDLDFICVKESILVLGTHVCRCLATVANSIFVANDDGFICLFSTDPLALKHTFSTLSGKILSLACNSDEVIAAGTSLGSLTVCSLSGIRWVLMKEATNLKIWSLLFLSNTLFSGDSRGIVSVWDVNVGGLLQSFPAHASHVMSLVASVDGKAVFSGGSDALVRRYNYCVSEDGQSCWDLAGTLRGCRRDIRGLIYLPGQHYDPRSQKENLDTRFEPHRLLAVGLDARLQILACEQPERGLDALANAHRTLACMVGRPRDTVTKALSHIAALPFRPFSCCSALPDPISFCPAQLNSTECSLPRWCLFHYPDRLSLVQLARPAKPIRGYQLSGSRRTHHLLRMADELLQLAEIRPKKGSCLMASCISNDRGLIAYSDLTITRILKLEVTSDRVSNIPSVSIRRLQYTENERKRMYSTSSAPEVNLASSSETDTDTDDLSASEIAKFFAINQPDTDHLIPPSRVQPLVRDVFTFPSGEGRSTGPSVLPSARCLAFTPDSSCLLLIPRTSTELICFSLQTGKVRWRSNLTSGTGNHFVVHRLVVYKECTVYGFVLGLGCSDGRVRLHSAETGRLLFKTPRMASSTGHFPLPISLAFYHRTRSQFDLSVLYTSSQLSEWSIILSIASDGSDDRVLESLESIHIKVEAIMNTWLTGFWSALGNEISTTLGVLHSMAYMDGNTWLLASDRYLALLIRNEHFAPGMIKDILSNKTNTDTHWCIRLTTNFESIIQATVIDNYEIAVVCLHSAGIALGLSAPLQQKKFGT